VVGDDLLTSLGDEQGIDWKGQVSEKDVGDHPVNRAGRPKDIADAALYLIDSGFVTGECYVLMVLWLSLTFLRPGYHCGRRSFAQEELSTEAENNPI
jgi:hypothetical protein